jgi:DNA-binding transcriptional LysR family regulator
LELRHLRYFVAIAEEGSFTRAGNLLRVAQPALSRQIRHLETEVGVALLHRSPRGVKLTPAGEAFLVEARRALEHATLAAESARSASGGVGAALRFAHGQLYNMTRVAEELLASFRTAHPDVRVDVTGQPDPETQDALRAGSIDVGCVFLAEWPPQGFEGHALAEISLTGVLLPASHPLAAKSEVSLAEMRALPWLTLEPERWPGFQRVLEDALRGRGLHPRAANSGPIMSPFIHIAAGAGWGLANEEVGGAYRGNSSAIAYRPFVEPPIALWLSLVWTSPAAPVVERLVAAAQRLGLAPVGEDQRKAVSKPA